jgi:MFS family permease
MTTPALGQRIYPRYIIQAGLVLLFVGGFILAGSLETATESSDLALGLLVGGIAIGLIAGQLPNLILSGVEPKEASEASGLQGTAQNLGMALGTAIIGTVILGVSIGSIGNQVEASATIPDENKPAVEETLTGALTSANPEAFREELATAPADVQEDVAKVYDKAAIDGFQGAIIVGGIVALLGAVVAFWLPKQKIKPEGEGFEQIVRDTVRNTTIAKMQLEMDDLSASSEPPQA